ncbi:MAG: BMC domain-containing protein [Chloroflexi bacterium]|jgi:microcompartment protein CcmL/EutN|nr:BMC domain-containing protein [Chloroflexota bacterium]MBK6709035.1 BMC domain-containing protein [Chloroflexota bacterium]MBK7175787.1 BMC domain-containing protein [Chloroflexota bacterium]MBK7914812.1 BMC domain-containing protein [Chloroflexota bacterium]MBK8936003.1 BMC domain-containing protein [Chloroflexota bacterium]
MKQALGLIETIGLVSAIEAADAAVKAANVTLLGYENTKGGGKITVKFVGDVGAVKAAVAAGVAAASRIGKVYGQHIIPRPHDEIEALIANLDRGKKREPERELEEELEQEEEGGTAVSEPQQCIALTKSGERCKRTAVAGSEYCATHRKLEE